MALFDQTFRRTIEVHYPQHVAESVEVLIVGETTPVYAHPGDAGADLCSAEAVHLRPGERATIRTGVSIALPDGFVGFVVPRSGLAARHGITIVNSPGTVDAGYRGEIRITLLNTDSSVPYPVAVGDRIAQLIVMPIVQAKFVPVETLPGSHRGSSGFGSTGYRGQKSGEK
jgi:dUTP pyrophosphatase